MIVQCRIDIDDERRNALARWINPNAKKALASRQDVKDFVNGCIAALCEDDDLEDEAPPLRALAATVNGHSRMEQLMNRAMKEDFDHLRDKSESYVRGWVKVKYAKEIRA